MNFIYSKSYVTPQPILSEDALLLLWFCVQDAASEQP